MNRAAALAALALGGCGAPRSYMGIDLTRPSATAWQAQGDARLAAGGDAAAQLALGRAFEEARGVPLDLDRACRLYDLASRTTGGTMYVYSPKVGKSPAQVIPITTPVRQGLREADERLRTLRYRASANDRARSRCLARSR